MIAKLSFSADLRSVFRRLITENHGGANPPSTRDAWIFPAGLDVARSNETVN
jgi:hypothetical protein